MKRIVVGFMMAVALASQAARAEWQSLLADDFSAPPSAWTYQGVQNATNGPLFRYDAAHQRIAAEWDQTNYFSGAQDPYVISNSWFARPLPQPLTEQHSFRLRATLRVAGGSIPDTTEFYQLAVIGLYGLTNMGPDRALADDFAFPLVINLLRNASDAVEFNYFINNESFGFNPNIGALIAGHVTNNTDYYYVTGSGADVGWFHNTDMGADQYLPTDTDLFLEVGYFGHVGSARRRLLVALYTDAARTNLVEVNGVPMYYWTQPLSAQNSFELTHAAMVNYASSAWATPPGRGEGSWDDVAVDLFDGQLLYNPLDGGDVKLSWTAVSGLTYAVMSAPDLMAGPFTTQAVVTASAGFAGWTNAPLSSMEFWFVKPLQP